LTKIAEGRNESSPVQGMAQHERREERKKKKAQLERRISRNKQPKLKKRALPEKTFNQNLPPRACEPQDMDMRSGLDPSAIREKSQAKGLGPRDETEKEGSSQENGENGLGWPTQENDQDLY